MCDVMKKIKFDANFKPRDQKICQFLYFVIFYIH